MTQKNWWPRIVGFKGMLVNRVVSHTSALEVLRRIACLKGGLGMDVAVDT